MKEDKEQQLDELKDELAKKVEKLMGPTPEKRPAAGAPEIAEVKSAPEIPSTSKLDKKVEEPLPVEKPVGELLDEAKLEPDETDDKLAAAVDDIAASESDELLKAEDDAVKKAFEDKPPVGFFGKAKQFAKDWFSDPTKRRATIGVALVLLVAAAVFPNSRYFVLNTVGIRSSASLKVIDEGTQQPLKNVTVNIQGQTAVTNEEGTATLSKLKLGKTEVTVERAAFAPTTKPYTLGWGSNPLGDFSLTPVGLQYKFNAKDFLSGQPIQKAEAISGPFSAFANEQGEIVLTVDTKEDQDVQISIRAEGYREENLTAKANDKEAKEVKMVPARKHVFVSKRSGKFDVYKIDADGKNEELLLSGSGTEREDMVLAGHPDRDIAALISSRENMRNEDGYLLSTLYLIDTNTGEKTSLGRSERFQIIGWIGDRLVYAKIIAGASGDNPKRQRLMSYDFVNDNSTEIAATNSFNDVLVAKDKIYYAPSGAYQKGINVGLFVVDADGGNKKVLVENETWNLFRTGYDELTIAVGKAWYKYQIDSTEAPSALNGAPADPKSRVYVDNGDGSQSLWVDTRDGKGVLLAYDTTSKEDKNLAAQSGLSNPTRWLNNSTIVFRVNNDQETADYVVSLSGGEPKKLTDVTNTAGVDKWYYY